MSDLEKTAPRNVLLELKKLTQARIATGRVGDALPTSAVLSFEAARAQARDAVHQSIDAAEIIEDLSKLGLNGLTVRSQAVDRKTYIMRPDAGRLLDEESRTSIRALDCRQQTIVVLADGLSAAAVRQHGAPLLAQLLCYGCIPYEAPVIIAQQARVALGDEIGALMSAAAVIVLIGERPGLSTAESMGAYLTWAPRVGRRDSERNCVSNIDGDGLTYSAAAAKIALLLRNASLLGKSGVELHDESDDEPYALS